MLTTYLNRYCKYQSIQWIILLLFMGICYIYFDNIFNVFRRLQYNTMRLANKSLFIPPQSVYVQRPEKRLHFPHILFTNPYNSVNSSLCQYTKLETNTIDSNGNICKIQHIDHETGCCNKNNIIDDNKKSSLCKSITDTSTYHVPYKLYSNDISICCNSYIECINKCLNEFIAKPFDLSIESRYKFDHCKYICRTSSKSTTKSRYYLDSSYKYCFGNAFYPKIQYNIISLFAPSFKLILANSDNNCKQTCKILNNSHCSVLPSEIFGDDCKYHQKMTSTKCKTCKIGKNSPSIQYFNTDNQICYRSSKINKNVCDFKQRDASQQNICLCTLLL